MEHVLVIPNTVVCKYLNSVGFVPSNSEVLDLLLRSASFLPRDCAEGNPNWRQVIPYVVVQQGSSIFVMRRLKEQSESRLHLQFSCGVGGHINPCDSAQENIVVRAAVREVDEEIVLADFSPAKLQFHGFINDYSTPVSCDHLGCLYTVEATGNVSVRETTKMKGSFMTRESISLRLAEFETWSQLAFCELNYVKV